MMNRFRIFAWFAFAAGASQAQADGLPVARIAIYPGDALSDAVIDERPYALAPGTEALYVRSRDALVGKVARRTLLPGQPIPIIAVDNPRIVTTGAQIKIVFLEGGLQIVAYGVAQQAGAVGDLIRVRNQDSGIFVSGRVQADGSVRVGEG